MKTNHTTELVDFFNIVKFYERSYKIVIIKKSNFLTTRIKINLSIYLAKTKVTFLVYCCICKLHYNTKRFFTKYSSMAKENIYKTHPRTQRMIDKDNLLLFKVFKRSWDFPKQSDPLWEHNALIIFIVLLEECHYIATKRFTTLTRLGY